jgi:hypothetical protein
MGEKNVQCALSMYVFGHLLLVPAVKGNFTLKTNKETNSMAFNPQANYND